jgi:uncharacterized membrane protein
MALSPVLFAVVAMVAWGLWAVLANVAAESLAPTTAMILSYGTGVAVALAYVLVRGDPVSLSRAGVAFALAAGVFSGVGAVAFYAGLEQGRTGVVTTVSALYFVVAAVVGVAVLGESLDATDAAGVGFAVLSVLLLAR